MNYKLIPATTIDIPKLVDYKLKNIFDYVDNLSIEENIQINNYVRNSVPKMLNEYKIICVDNKKNGCLLVREIDNGVLLDEIYLDNNYRNKGIGTDIIKNVILKNKIIYLWVYKLNINAVSLYKRLGFKIIDETESRYYMKYDKEDC